MAINLLAKRIDQRLANDIRCGYNSHRHGDLYAPAAAVTANLRLATLSITPFIMSIVFNSFANAVTPA